MKSRYTNSQAPRAPIAPLHRGPQAMSRMSHVAAVAPVAQVHAPNAALLIDFDNVTMGIRSDLQTELRNLLSSDIIQGKVAVQRAYADWRRYPQYIVPLSEASIDLIFAPAYGSSKKNATDIRLAIDALELVFTRPEIGTFILLSGDSDFSSLVIKLKEYGKYVIGVGIRESSSDLLVQNCDEYYSYNALAGLVKSGEVEGTHKWDPWELVTEAINRMQQNHDVMRSDRLKQVMQEIDNNFDEKDLGMSKFSKFCQEAAHRGLIKTTKLENGQMEVAATSAATRAPRPDKPARPERPPRTDHSPEDGAGAQAEAITGEEAEPARATPDSPAGEGAVDAPPEREGRTRRGRRGGRGRKRAERPEARERDAENATPAEGTVVPVTPEIPSSEIPSVESNEPQVPAAPTAESPERPARARAARAPRTAAVRQVIRQDVDESIGVAGLRLTRDEAMALVREAVAQATGVDDTVRDEQVRRKAFELLGRDSESLSVRNFSRILRDAHDSNIADVRRRGDGFEVARAADVASVTDQLAEREQAAKEAELPADPVAPAPRGMGPRAAPGRGRRAAGRQSTAVPDLLLVGVVDPAPAGAEAPPDSESKRIRTGDAESA